MNEKRFDHPIFVRYGKELVREVTCLEEAFDFLDEWPEDRRGTIFETARRACHAAWDGRYPIDAARNAFEGWARSAKILEDSATVMPWIAAAQSGRGGAPA